MANSKKKLPKGKRRRYSKCSGGLKGTGLSLRLGFRVEIRQEAKGGKDAPDGRKIEWSGRA